jgi:RND family efflux transporter MFP subunit
MSANNHHNGSMELEPQRLEPSRAAIPVFPTNHNQPDTGSTSSHTVFEEKALPNRSMSRRGRKLLVAIIAALIIVGCVLWQRSRVYSQLAITTAQMALPTVSTVLPQPGPAQVEIKLPGNLMAYSEASIYARTNGYVKAWYTDIGAKLTAGELMAEIEAPDVDAQLRQASANLSQARADLEIAKLDYGRAKDLLATKVISQQEYDQDHTNFEARQATVQAGEANVQDLTVQQGFEKITAPFNGVVTRRDTDVGSLINAGSSSASSTAQELFHIARTDILRVYISMPEVYSPLVKIGTPALLELAEYPGVKFHGKVADVAGAIDPSTRTLLTEVQVPNKDGRLFPGAYAIVHLMLNNENPRIVIPINTIIFRSEGTQVGVVDHSNIVHLKNVTVGHNFGTSLEVTSGVESNDRLILNPSDSLAEGAKVQVQNQSSVAN